MLSKSQKKPLTLWYELDGYQKKAVCFSAVRNGSALFFDQGTGKTWITLGLIEYIEAKSVLLVVPKTNLETTWAQLIAVKLKGYQIHYEWDNFLKSKYEYKILLINYEKLPSFVTKAQRFGKKHRWDLIAFDESQRLKQRSSRNSRMARRFKDLCDCKVILSGTPMDASPIELWGQLRFVIPEIVGDTWTKFVERWCYKGGWMNKQVFFDDKKLDQFMDLIQPYCKRIKLNEVIDIEEPIQEEVWVNLDEEQRDMYDEMDKDMVTRIGRNRAMAQLTITRNVKLHQITNGWLKDDNGIVHRIGNAKERGLRRILKKVKPPVVIFCKFIEDMAIVADCLPQEDRIEFLYGGIKDTKRNKARTNLINDFQAGKIDWFIVQLKTGGVGVDLFRSHIAIFYSMGHSYIDNDQAKSRLQRRGQTRQVRIFLILARNTIDDDLLEAYRSKRSLTSVVLEKLKHRRIDHG